MVVALCVLCISSAWAADSSPDDLGQLMPIKRPELTATTLQSMAQLLNIPQVKEELKLNEEQQAQLQALITKSREATKNIAQTLNNTPAAERQAMVKKLHEATADVYKELPTLLSPAQLDRAFELQVQKLKFDAIQLPEVAQVLKITDEQRAKLEELQQNRANSMQAALRNIIQNGNNAANRAEQIKAELEKAHSQFLEEQSQILTKDQQARLQRLQGKKLDGLDQLPVPLTTRFLNVVPVQKAVPVPNAVPIQRAVPLKKLEPKADAPKQAEKAAP